MVNNKERISKLSKTNENISLDIGSMSVTNPHHISYKFNAYFVDNVDRILYLNKVYKQGHVPINNIIHNPHSMFLVPVTEEEVHKVTNKLKVKYSVGYDEIPEMIINNVYSSLKNH
jgi:hypothetical protein